MTSATAATPSSSNNAMIIFDWDDTILPSSFVDKLQADNLADMPREYHDVFREIELSSEKCLAAAAEHGEVILITNSDEGWVKYSAERYLPGLLPALEKYRIVSARTRYERFYPNQPLCWKAAAFAHEVNEHFCQIEEAHRMLDRECSLGKFDDGSLPDMDLASTDDSSLEDNSISSAECVEPLSPDGGFPAAEHVSGTPRQRGRRSSSSSAPIDDPVAMQREIISFGDSVEERTAVRIVSDQLDALPKSVKFLDDPTPMQIIGQLTMLTHHMGFVCRHAEDLDLEISKKQAEKCAGGYFARKKAKNAGGGSTKDEPSPSILQRILGTTTNGSTRNHPPGREDVDMEHYDC